ncbi:vomeronasal type-2 receptor 26-like [Eleutherodactylus coqui]|uniref:vomeronasal type-2 receptor 26-like n=1 Tax=Eleutherodactylus coqui TaxID=57060 RepID=UPI00346268A2
MELQTAIEDYEYYKHGDYIIGGIVAVNFKMEDFLLDPFNKFMNCNGILISSYKYFLEFQFAIEEVNKNPNILPNVTLGYHVYDSCSNANKAVKSVIQILSGPGATVPNYYCAGEENIGGFVGDLLSLTTLPIAQMLSIYGYTQISYGATDPRLSDRAQYPYLFRTAHSDLVYFSAVLQLLKRFLWNWVGIITSDDDSGDRESQALSSFLNSHGICIEFILTFLPHNSNKKELGNRSKQDTTKKSPEIISRSSSNIILVCGTVSLLIANVLKLPDNVLNTKTFILPPSWFTNYLILEKSSIALNCCLGFLHDMEPGIPYNNSKELMMNPYDTGDMKQFIKNIHPSKYPDDMLLEEIWMLNRYLRTVRYKVNSEGRPYFDDNGGLNTMYFIYNWVKMSSKSSKFTLVGSVKPWAQPDQQLFINSSDVTWKNKEVPRSRCSNKCPPGSRKIKKNMEPICCYDCVACSDGEISNITDSEKCTKCLDTEWSSSKRDQCFQKLEEFLAFSDGLSITLSSIALLFWTISILIFGIFVSHKNTPVVKANNKNLSFILLISLSLCFLCVFLFIGRPVDRTCRLRQIVFGIIFTIAVSSILAKTILVYMVFKMSRPGNQWKKLIGIKVSNFIVVMFSSIEVIISIYWLNFSPPYVEQDTHSYQRKIIIQCNEGSQVAFFAVLGYLFFLAALSFTVAYLARTLPDRFNEAKYITFSMLVFCSVWIAMVPSYLCSKGKNMVVVEIFSILASSAGLLGFIFFPKCYIILLKPQMNRRNIRHGNLYK